MCRERLVDGVQDGDHLRVVEVLDAEHLLDLVNARFGEGCAMRLLVDPIIARLFNRLADLALGSLGQPGNDLVHHAVEVDVLLRAPGDDQRCTGLVDQDRVHFVDDRVGELALDTLFERELHVVSQVVEAEFVVGHVGDVTAVGFSSLRVVEVVNDHTDRKPQEAVYLAHPGSVALREVVVDGHDVDAAPAERIQIGGECRDERLPLARLHLGDRASVEHDAADQLHVVVALSEGSLGGFAHGGERLGQEVVQGLALFETLLELARAHAQRRIGEPGTLRLEPVDPLDGGFELLDQPVVRAAEDLFDEAKHLRRAISRGVSRAESVYESTVREPMKVATRQSGSRGWG